MISNIINVAQFRAVTATSTVTGSILAMPLGQTMNIAAHQLETLANINTTVLTTASKDFEDFYGTELPDNCIGAELTFTTAVRVTYGGTYSAYDTVLAAGTYRFGAMAENGVLELVSLYSTTVTTVGADADVGVQKVEQRFTYSLVTADAAVKSGAGLLHSLAFAPNDATPTAGSIIVYDNTAESGTQIFNWNVAATAFIPFSVLLDIEFGTGLYVGFTTTNDVNVTVCYR